LKAREKATPVRFFPGDAVIVVSASSGGMGPLVRLLVALPADLRASLLALAPVPACYLWWFLRRIDRATSFHLRPARDSLPLKRGVAYLAPYDHKVVVGSRGLLTIEFDAFQKDDRASVDATLTALATRYGPAVVSIILSGIGCAGIQGALDVRAAGGSVIVQEPSTCVVEETPKAILEAGAATAVLPPEQIWDEITRSVECA
jgi:two-component system chemotaxis response regulator CheB